MVKQIIAFLFLFWAIIKLHGAEGREDMSIVSLVICIIGIFAVLVPFANIVTVFIPVLGIILGIIAYRISKSTGHKVVSVISVILGAAGIVLTVAVNVGIINLIQSR